jgi:hypothetical protein
MSTDIRSLLAGGNMRLSLFLILFGLVFVAFGARSITLMCFWQPDLSADCTLDLKWMGFIDFERKVIRNVQWATVQESCDDDGCTYRAVLNAPSESLPVDSVYTSGSQPRETAEAVNDWLNSNLNENLEVTLGFTWWLFLPGMLLGIVGLYAFMRSIFAKISPVR